MNTVKDISEIAEQVRAKRHVRCAKCGYDLFGQRVRGKCPECGESIWESLGKDSIHRQRVAWIRQRLRWAGRHAMWVLPTLFVLACLLSIRTLPVTQYSPDSFRVRRGQYLYMQLLDWRLTKPKFRSSSNSRVQRYLVAEDLIKDLDDESARWQRIGEHTPFPFALGITPDDPFWVGWSRKNPELAAAVWPVIIELAQMRIDYSTHGAALILHDVAQSPDLTVEQFHKDWDEYIESWRAIEKERAAARAASSKR